MQNKGVTADALKHLETAHKLNPDHAEVSVDLARTYSIFGASQNRSDSERQNYFTQARLLYEDASAQDSTNPYVYEVWAGALYWQGDYAGSWQMVEQVRQLGGVPSEGFLKQFASKMPAPTSR